MIPLEEVENPFNLAKQVSENHYESKKKKKRFVHKWHNRPATPQHTLFMFCRTFFFLFFKWAPSEDTSWAISTGMGSQSIYGFTTHNIWKLQRHIRERWHFVSGHLCLWHHEQGRHVWQKCTSWASFFCSSLEKSEPTWLHPKALNFKAK